MPDRFAFCLPLEKQVRAFDALYSFRAPDSTWSGIMVYLLPPLSGGRTSYHRPRCPIPSGIPAVSQNRRGQLISSLKWDVLPSNLLHPAHGILRRLSLCTAFSRLMSWTAP